MESSAYYAAKILEFEGIKNKVSSLFGPLGECQSTTQNSSKYTEKLIICGKVFDKDELKKFSEALTTVSSNLNAIIAECNEKKTKYQSLYEKALAWEKEQEKKKSY